VGIDQGAADMDCFEQLSVAHNLGTIEIGFGSKIAGYVYGQRYQARCLVFHAPPPWFISTNFKS
jgi:hypothetical protein